VPSLQIKPKPSRILGFAIAILHVLAIYACIANTLPVVIKVIIPATVIFSFWLNWQRYITKPDPCTLLHSEARGWEWMDAKQQVYPVSIAGSSVTSPMITILHLQLSNKLKKVMIFVRDAVSAEDYRQLRVRLKIYSSD
jgi:hypothetical protein